MMALNRRRVDMIFTVIIITVQDPGKKLDLSVALANCFSSPVTKSHWTPHSLLLQYTLDVKSLKGPL
jgi:hypothetical protein